ncbi:MAG: CehA/McbA family metallohydrolase [Coriobacteriia bacterium]
MNLDYVEIQSGEYYQRLDVDKAVPSVLVEVAELRHLDGDPRVSPSARSAAAGRVRGKVGKAKTTATPNQLTESASDETTLTLTATSHFMVDGAPLVLTSSATVAVADWTEAPVGWLAGDAHVHSTYSDGSGTVSEDAAAAVDTELDFLVMTDHSDKMTSPDFGDELRKCASVTCASGVRLIMGQEYAVNPGFLSADGHYLAYSPDYYIDPTGITHQSIIDAVDTAGALGVIAHPNHYTMGWSDWSVSGYTGLEILSDGFLSDSDAGLREDWDALIAQRSGGVGLGNSDAHRVGDIGTERTYVYTGGSTSESAILAAIKDGRTVISNGIFVNCEVNGRGIGGHVRASFGDTLSLRVDWPAGQDLASITVVYNGEESKHRVDAEANSRSEMTTPIAATEEGAIRIEASDAKSKDAYTNPVFIDLGVSGGVIDLAFVIDTTGSMWDDIAAAKTAAAEIASALEGVDARVSIVDYRDFPQWPYGTRGDYSYHDVLGFTGDQTVIAARIQNLRLGNWMDWRESVYAALMHTIDGTSLGGSRQQPNKYIILIGDAPPHDPEPFTGYEMQDVLDARA